MKTVLTIGCFDILHEGHIEHLTQARLLGDELVVAVYSDKVIRAYKGPPALPLATRYAVLKALTVVSRVVVLNERRFVKLIKQVKPAILAAGSGWGRGGIYAEARKLVKIVHVPYTSGVSSSLLRRRICQLSGQ